MAETGVPFSLSTKTAGSVPLMSPPRVGIPLSLLVNVFQSAEVNKPVVPVVAVGMAWLVAAVILPCWSTVNWPTEVEVP